MQLIIDTLAPLIFLIALGYILKFTIADNNWSAVLNKLAVYILFPSLIFSGMIKVNIKEIDDFSFIYWNMAILTTIILTLFLVTKWLKFSKERANTYVISVFFGNVGYLGFPILHSLMPGYEGVVSIHIAIYTLLLFTFGIAILEYSVYKKVSVKIVTDTFKNPLMIAVLLSTIVILLDIKLPFTVIKSIDLLAGGATPIILISLGLFLAQKLPKVSYKDTVALVLLKLIVVPLIFYIYFYLDGNSKVVAISVLEAGMPVAITPFVLGELYPMDRELIALCIIISCFLSIATLPLLMILVGAV